MMKTKRQIKVELQETKSDNLYYRSKLDLLQGILRAQRETNENAYTTLRKLNEIMTYFNKENMNNPLNKI